MSDEFGVSTDELMAIVARIADFEKRIEAMIADVDRQVAGLHATWHGTGASAQADAHRRWTEGAQQMRDALKDLHEAGAKAHRNYTGAARANLTMWS
ncbi:WXG100 family type VII secretion target [Mycolicibacterium sp. J2]|uniref:WXG100 family type VII secretion target n=1 Tax=Mycolicibacterium sp. J2 TaxID=2993511 RepID=UPI00224ABBD4|nr:WXG100 family type VII secretion target [Mycolicibacterium sp. J2]MCX2711958.1 WXG100 family type VII secretion target [Mycolicibacterium sp. J2]